MDQSGKGDVQQISEDGVCGKQNQSLIMHDFMHFLKFCCSKIIFDKKFFLLRHSVQRGWFPPCLEVKILIPPLNFLPPGSSKTEFPPQEAFIISTPTNCQVGLTAISVSENSSAYKLLKVSRVIYYFKIVSGLTFESISF